VLRQGFYMTIPPSRWFAAARSFKKQVMALKTKHYEAFYKALHRDPAYKEAKAAGMFFSGDEPLTAREEQFASRLASKLPWVRMAEQAFKVYLDAMRIETFKVYKRSIDKSFRDPRERFESYQASAEWINTSSGRGKFRGKFGELVEGAIPFLNVFGWSPRYLISRIQMLNPRTYAQNLTSPQKRVVFVKQMSELFQAAAVLVATGALAKAAGGDVSFDEDKADFLKIRFGAVRWDVLAGLQQVARLGIKMGKFLEARATMDSEEDKKELKKMSRETVSTMGRFVRGKLAPAPGFFVDWLNDWQKVTGEVHRPGEFIGDLKEGQYMKAASDFSEDPIASQALPLFWADMVQSYWQGYRNQGTQGGLEHMAKTMPGFLGVGTQDYDRPDYSKETRKTLSRFQMEPHFPKRKPDEKEDAYQLRVRNHIAEQEATINRFSSDPAMIGQPKERLKKLLQEEMSTEGMERIQKIPSEDLSDDRMVRAWVLVGVERLKASPVYKQMSESEQRKALESYHARMNRFRAQVPNDKHGYRAPDVVDQNDVDEQIERALNRGNNN